MKIIEYKLYGKQEQFKKIDEAIRTTQFIRNKCIRLWIDNKDKSFGRYDFSNYCAILSKEYIFVNKLDSMARQASAERAWEAVARFYAKCKKKIKGKKGYPKFKKNCRSVEYKTCGWKITNNVIHFGNFRSPREYDIGKLKMRGGEQLTEVLINCIKRIRVVKRADGYYAQFAINIPNVEYVAPTKNVIGLDVGINHFYIDSNNEQKENPKFYRKAERKLSKLQKKVSVKKKGSKNRKKSSNRLARKHLKVHRQRKDFVVKTARCVVKSNDFVAVENLNVRNMLKNNKLAKSISDASWGMFVLWLKHFGNKFGKTVIAVDPKSTSQMCSKCGKLPKINKILEDREHNCKYCNFKTCRDHNAALNILARGLNTAGHAEINAWGDLTTTSVDESQLEHVESLNQELLDASTLNLIWFHLMIPIGGALI